MNYIFLTPADSVSLELFEYCIYRRKSSPGPEGNNIKRMHKARRSILSFELDLDGLSGKENDFGVERRDEAGICSLSEDTAGNVCHTNVPLTEFIVQVDRRRMRSKVKICLIEFTLLL